MGRRATGFAWPACSFGCSWPGLLVVLSRCPCVTRCLPHASRPPCILGAHRWWSLLIRGDVLPAGGCLADGARARAHPAARSGVRRCTGQVCARCLCILPLQPLLGVAGSSLEPEFDRVWQRILRGRHQAVQRPHLPKRHGMVSHACPLTRADFGSLTLASKPICRLFCVWLAAQEAVDVGGNEGRIAHAQPARSGEFTHARIQFSSRPWPSGFVPLGSTNLILSLPTRVSRRGISYASVCRP